MALKKDFKQNTGKQVAAKRGHAVTRNKWGAAHKNVKSIKTFDIHVGKAVKFSSADLIEVDPNQLSVRVVEIKKNGTVRVEIFGESEPAKTARSQKNTYISKVLDGLEAEITPKAREALLGTWGIVEASSKLDAGFVSPLTGEAHEASSVEEAAYTSLIASYTERKRLLDNTIDTSQVAEMLGWSKQTPHDRLKSGALIAAKDGGKWKFPLWQFSADAPDGVVAGIRDVVGSLSPSMSDIAMLRWFASPKALLGGDSPAEALNAGRVQDVVEEALTTSAA